jgi:hypothetical protein
MTKATNPTRKPINGLPDGEPIHADDLAWVALVRSWNDPVERACRWLIVITSIGLVIAGLCFVGQHP